jgi:hypothetical protein
VVKKRDPVVKEESSLDVPSCEDQPPVQEPPPKESQFFVKKISRKKHGMRKSNEAEGSLERKKQLHK